MQTTIVNLQALDALSSTLESIALASQMLDLQLETPKLHQITFFLRLYQMQVTSLVTFTKLALIQSPYKNTYGLFCIGFSPFCVSKQKKLSNHLSKKHILDYMQRKTRTLSHYLLSHNYTICHNNYISCIINSLVYKKNMQRTYTSHVLCLLTTLHQLM